MALVIFPIISVQLGAALAKSLFDSLGPGGTVFLRIAFAALELFLLVRPKLGGHDRAGYLVAGLFGLTLAGMNFSIYLAFDRIPLGIAVTLEFVGPLGVAVAGSGLWMTLFYPGAPGGDLLWGIRLLVGAAMAASIVLGFAAIRRRDIPAHRAWMVRAYALGLGAGTQAFTEGIGEALLGITDLSKAISLGSGWVINAVVAEWVIRRPSVRRVSRARTRAALAVSQ